MSTQTLPLIQLSSLQYLAKLEMAQKQRKYPNVPYLVKPKYVVKDTNSLTKAVQRCLELHDCYVTRIQSQGQWNEHLNRFTTSTTKRGTADLHASISGRHVSIEIKWGKDKLSAAQKKTAQQVELSGGLYIVVADYDTFWSWFEQQAPQLVEQKRGELI